jgi:hypothetical protein
MSLEASSTLEATVHHRTGYIRGRTPEGPSEHRAANLRRDHEAIGLHRSEWHVF